MSFMTEGPRNVASVMKFDQFTKLMNSLEREQTKRLGEKRGGRGKSGLRRYVQGVAKIIIGK